MKSSHSYECSTTLAERNPIPVCACGCGEAFGPKYTGRNRFKRGHYRFIPDQHIVDPETGCWLWTGSVSRSGHGLARNDKGINEHAHRLYYEALVRPLADDEIAHHDEAKCCNKLCCNPEHQKIISKSEHQRHHALLQWERQHANPTEHHIGITSARQESAHIPATDGGPAPFRVVTSDSPCCAVGMSDGVAVRGER